MTQHTNVLFLCSDQHSPRVAGCYGNDIIQTPNMDALAARGTRFENGYCNSPICIPGRAAMATGRYVHDCRYWDNAIAYDGLNCESWGHRLQAQGHAATTIGKLHYKGGCDTGFDEHNAMYITPGGLAEVYSLYRAEAPNNPAMRDYVLNAAAGEFSYTPYDRRTTAQAVQWLQEDAPQLDKPWATFVSWSYPHFPFIAPKEFVDLYPLDSVPLPIQGLPEEWDMHPRSLMMREAWNYTEPFTEEQLRQVIAVYYGMVSFVDHQIGQVLQALDDSGQRENTLVIYTSDHGEMLGEKGFFFKSVMFESSAAVPFMIAGPGVPEGKICHTPVSHVDLFPTIVESVGAHYSDKDEDLPGKSLVAIANSEDDKARPILCEYHSIASKSGIFMIRNGKWKYVYQVQMPAYLYDLDADPDELENLAEDPTYAQVIQECHQALETFCDPEAVDALARREQMEELERRGGFEKMLAEGIKHTFTPAPSLEQATLQK